MSKSYCDMPWEHQYIHMSGSYRLCCATNDNLLDKNNNRHHINNSHPAVIWNGEQMRQIRLKMLAGKEISSCSKCLEQEARGYKSMRISRNLSKNKMNTESNGSIQSMPRTMELHLGNVCNLKCKMCSQNYSNQVGKELLTMGEKDKDFLQWVIKESGNVNNWTNNLSVEYQWYQNPNTKKKLFEHVNNNIELLTVIGGEPTVIPEFYELLEYCYEKNTLGNKNITIVTNLTNTNPKMTNWLSNMKKWTIWASIDGLDDRNSYIRYPSNWKKILENLNFYKNLIKEQGNGNIVFSPAIQLLNIDQLPEIIDFFKNFSEGNFRNGNKKFDMSWMAQVWYPKICNYDIAPRVYKDSLIEKLSGYSFLDPFYKSQIDNLKQEPLDKQTKRHLQNAFIRYNDAQDQHRKCVSWRQLLPNLEKTLIDELSQ
jgi:MoaA/NifB/PqqE/SkfB family radical SAM enzyme